MAQTRYFNYKADDDTASQNRHYLGIIDKGLYRGFDAQLAAGLNLTLTQSLTGETEIDENQNVLKKGVIVTGQGVVIKEDANVVLPITANTSGTGRVDYIVCEHQYVYVAGGSPAQYKVLIGGANNAPPAMTNLQTLLGILTMPNGATSLLSAGVSYAKAAKPEFAGGQGYLTADKDETITGNKTFKSLQYTVGTATVTNDGVLTLNGKYNRYKVTYTAGTTYPVINSIAYGTSGLTAGFGLELFTEDDNGMVFNRSGNITWSDAASSTSTQIFVADNEYISMVMKVASTFTVEFFPGMYMMRDAKFFNTVREHTQATTIPANNGALLNIYANTYDVTAGDSNSYILGLQAVKSKMLVAASDVGTVVRIKCVGAVPLKLIHNWTTSPVTLPGKVLLLAGETDLIMQPGEVITFIEEAAAWKMIGYYSPLQSEAKFRKDTANTFSATQSWGAVTINETTVLEGGYNTLLLPATGNTFLIEFLGSTIPMAIGDVKRDDGSRFPPGTCLTLQFRKASAAANNSACYIVFKTDPTTGYDGSGIRKPLGMPSTQTLYQLIDLGVVKGTFGATIQLVADSAGKWMFCNYRGNATDIVEWQVVAPYDGAGGGTGDNPDSNLRVGIMGRNWVKNGNGELRYKKDAAGNVHVRGNVQVSGNNVGNNPTFQPYIMLLPVGLRPGYDTNQFYTMNFNQVAYPVSIMVDTLGRVQLRMDTGIAGTSGTYPPLSFSSTQSIWINIMFPAEQ